jgi:hypothetical protein
MEESVKQLMLLRKDFELSRFVCGICVLIRIRIRDRSRLDDVFQTLRCVVCSPKSFGSVPRQSWIDRKRTFGVEFYGTTLGLEVTLQHLPGVVRTLRHIHWLVISVSSVEEARRLCLKGVSQGKNLFCVSPFVFGRKSPAKTAVL